MTVSQDDSPNRETVADMDEALRGMMTRLRVLVEAPALREEGLVEVTAIFNNVAYIFLYLEANEEHVEFTELLPWRDAFHKDPALDRRILELLDGLSCPDPEAEESRVAYVAQLRAKKAAPAGPDDLDRLLAEAKNVLADVSRDQAALLARLGVPGSEGAPAAHFYRLVSATSNAGTRSKLALAWQRTTDGHLDALVARVDDMVDLRRQRSAGAGFPSVLGETLSRCRVTPDEVQRFLDRYLHLAIKGYVALEAETVDAVGEVDDAMQHFSTYVRSLAAGRRLPQFELQECLDYMFAVARAVFGVDIERHPGGNPHIVYTTVRNEHEDLGQIHFDLWDTDRKAAGANHTQGLRNRTDWSGMVQRPVAYVSCRFRQNSSGADLLTFQNVHSLFHEFGHAVNHVLMRRRISNQSGLEYLPLERIEYLSMWFEKWVYHPEFTARVTTAAADPEGVALCQRIKLLEFRRTYVERAVTAALDWELHRRSSGGLAEAFYDLDRSHGLSRYCKVGDFPVYFTWPMFVANPGANFSYLVGSAASCEKFKPFSGFDLEEVAAMAGRRDYFTECMDFGVPTTLPDPGAVFAFYDEDAALGVPFDL